MSQRDHGLDALAGAAAIGAIVGTILFLVRGCVKEPPPPPPPPPVKARSAQEVGEDIGSKISRFGTGVIKGIFTQKEKDKEEPAPEPIPEATKE